MLVGNELVEGILALDVSVEVPEYAVGLVGLAAFSLKEVWQNHAYLLLQLSVVLLGDALAVLSKVHSYRAEVRELQASRVKRAVLAKLVTKLQPQV